MKLEGFLTTQDVNTIKLSKGNIMLEFETPDAGESKVVKIDPRFSESFFALEGEGSENYILDKECPIEIKASILKRPINVEFYTVSKEYDGTPDFDKAYFRYRFCTTNEAASGLVLGTDSTSPYLDTTEVKVTNCGEFYNAGDTFKLTGCEPHQSIQNLGYDSTKSPAITITAESDSLYKANLNTFDNYVFRTSFPVVRNGNKFTLKVNDGDIPNRTYIEGSSTNSDIHSQLDKIENYPPFNIIYDFSHSDADFNNKRSGLELEITQELKQTQVDSPANPEGKRFVRSDIGKVFIDIDGATLPSKDVTMSPTRLSFTNLHLVGGDEDASNNYILNKSVGYGHITRRKTDLQLIGESKVYDGTAHLSYKLSNLSRLISGDEVMLDDAKVIAMWNSKNVNAAPVIISSPALTGKDADNYYVSSNQEIVNAAEIRISPRPITLKVDELKIYRDNGHYKATYSIDNNISGDDIYIDFTNALITLSTGETIENLFINSKEIDFEVLSWTGLNNLSGNVLEIQDSAGNYISDEYKVSISNFTLRGSDAKNYNLTTTAVNDIPISIINVY